ncbi:hypothetical protein QJS04_geneDACA022618 [Acorus gramineus]|uniref:Uncharacterized protein n=1 Tax=Acorus gramineus TaxID=55184 RepID=A0AAV9B409_ACOGR|nr:hypothetical protein QJS04_geneDACA022618 [Acorus gramineus]
MGTPAAVAMVGLALVCFSGDVRGETGWSHHRHCDRNDDDSVASWHLAMILINPALILIGHTAIFRSYNVQ